MNPNSSHVAETVDRDDTRPILIIPYMWIGDFVRGHTVVRVLKQRWPNRPVDMLTTSLCAPLIDYMPGVRSGLLWDLPRSRLALTQQWGLATRLRSANYGTALVMPRTWKSALAPFLGLIVCAFIWLNLGHNAQILGSIWLAIGLALYWLRRKKQGSDADPLTSFDAGA